VRVGRLFRLAILLGKLEEVVDLLLVGRICILTLHARFPSVLLVIKLRIGALV